MCARKADAIEHPDETVDTMEPLHQPAPEPAKPAPEPAATPASRAAEAAPAAVRLRHRATHERCTVDAVEYAATADAWSQRGFEPENS
jgi:hypothetical protein